MATMAVQIAGSPDVIPLRIRLQRVERRRKLKAFMLVLPLLLFILMAFVWPITRGAAVSAPRHDLGSEDLKSLQDCLFRYCVGRATECDLPVKIAPIFVGGHGMMQLAHNAGHLCRLLLDLPDTRFVLMHIGYSYERDFVGSSQSMDMLALLAAYCAGTLGVSCRRLDLPRRSSRADLAHYARQRIALLPERAHIEMDKNAVHSPAPLMSRKYFAAFA
ncbi:amidohydrolase [Bradyrhizobium sp. 192]|uniref:amidohydrolase n=1 Tax=Bradyrhizobium sp. 192 TaxID=2782660 RepID=UPI001FFF9BEC|nr:amidohydrolase [Bradyrhizobium sp. 192]UPJ59892.1 hypothetical protein IVB24_09340 [Bradyrhizobium sp. 192]